MKKESDLIKGVKGMAWMSSSTVIDYVINLITTFILARLLTPGDYGEVAAIGVLTGFADMLWQMGISTALVQKKNLTDADISTGHTLNILFGFTAFLVINIFAGFWINVFSITSITMLRVYSLVFILNCLVATPQAMLHKKCKFKLMSALSILSTVFYGVVAVILAKMGFGAWTLVYATILKYIFKGTLIYIKEKFVVGLYIDKQSAKDILFFGSGHTIAKFFNYIANNGDNFVVNKTLDKVALGSYTKAYSLIGYPANLIGGTIDNVLFPIFSKNQDDNNKLTKGYLLGTGLIAILSIPIAVAMYFCSESLILFYLGNGWDDVADCLKVMIVALFFRVAYKVCDTTIKAIGKVYQRSVVQIIYAFAIVGCAWLGVSGGLTSVAEWVTRAFIVNYLLMTGLCLYYLKLSVFKYIQSIIGPFIYGGVMVLISVLVAPYLETVPGNFLTCVAWVIVVFVPYAVLLLLTRRFMLTKDINQSFETVLKSMLNKLSHTK